MVGRTPRHVEVYVFRRRSRRIEFLCLRRAAKRSLPGVWQPITGKRRGRERAAVAAFREFYEETGLKALRMWALETVTAYFDPGSELLSVLPLFAIEVAARDRVRLSSEHDAARFTTARAAGSLYLWESQRRGLDAVQREVLTRKDLARALELRLEGGRLVL